MDLDENGSNTLPAEAELVDQFIFPKLPASKRRNSDDDHRPRPESDTYKRYKLEEEMLEVGCSGCGGRISDRYIMRVGERSYHERCLLCSVCTSPLTQTCFIRDLKLLCRTDYERLYQKKCLSCGEAIGPSELVMRASLEAVFHLRCFLCVVCGSPLQKGDQYVVKQGQLFCRPDYEKEVEMFQGYAQGETPLGEDGTPTRTDGRRGPKRPRTILTTQQRRAFKASFELSPKPCRKVRETLAKDTGLSVRIVQVWFQNQRAKIKKMQKKHRLDQKNNNSNDKDLELDEKLDKIKDDDHSSQGGCVGVTSYLGDSCSDTEVLPTDFSTGTRVKEERDETAFYRNIMADQQGISSYLQPHDGGKCEERYPCSDYQQQPTHNPYEPHFHQPQQPPTQQQNSMVTFMIAEGTKCEERYSCGDGQQQPTQQPYEPYFLGLQQPPTQQQNPIDRLYSMQSSYFEQELIHQHH